ncbi:MAG: protease pro-enzyme activation domain-containing protein, partial [Thermoplasmata archaeon]
MRRRVPPTSLRGAARPIRAAFAVAVLVSLWAVGGVPYAAVPSAGAGGSAATGHSGTVGGAAPVLSAGLDRPLLVAPAFTPGPDALNVGPLPSATPLTVLVGIGSPDLAALAAQATVAGTAGTGPFGRHLSPAQVADELGASPVQVATAVAFFSSHHLKATPSADRFLITVTGPASDVAAAFGTHFEEYRLGGRLVFSHPTAATLPAGLPWYGAIGLGNLSSPLPAELGPVTTARAPSALALARPSASCANGGGALPPCAIWNGYDYAGLLGAGYNGSGETVAVVDSFDSAYPQASLASDFSQFTSQFGLPGGAVTYAYPVPAGGTLNSTPSDNWADEDALDLQWARASAPGDNVLDTLTANSNAALYSAVDWIVAGDRAQVISLSWGEQDTGVYNAVDGGCAYACNASSDG